MASRLSNAELQSVLDALSRHPAGLSIVGLAGAEASEAERRAVHRRLKRLQEMGKIRKIGAGRNTHYTLADPSNPSPPNDKSPAQPETLFVPISPEGQLIQTILRKPQSQRTPVGYNRDFLTAYRPNETAYLTQRERANLAALGVTPSLNQPAGTYVRSILNRLLIDLSWSSSKLEGNTYSLLDTITLLEQGKSAEGKTAQETQMILNHKDAIEYLLEVATEPAFDKGTILNLHAILSNNLLPDPMASGRLRRSIVGIGGSVYHPLEDPYIVEECFNEILQKAAAIKDPFEQSLFMVIQIPYLQPFEDVNKRVSRLACNIPFINNNLSPLSFIEVEERIYIDAMLAVYELNATELARDMFVWAYERSARRYAAIRQSIGEPDQFRLRYRDELRQVVSNIIREVKSRREATGFIRAFSETYIPGEHQTHFIEVAETEVVGIHEGNYARYRVTPSEYRRWKEKWDAP